MSYGSRRRRAKRSSGGAGRLLLSVGAFLLFAGMLGAVAFVSWVSAIAKGVDLVDLKPEDPGATSIVYAKDGSKLGYIDTSLLRQEVLGKQMSPFVRQATVAVEDKRFYEHGGVDAEGVARAAFKTLTNTGREGASTLEMQLIRNLYTQDRAYDYKRKIREAKLAKQLEEQHPGRAGKEWVLTQYLNVSPYGNAPSRVPIKGVQAAALVYFGVPASKLTLAQSALIAGLPQAPTDYNPYLHPQAALSRRNEVIQRMADQGYVSRESAIRAQNSSLGLKKSGSDYFARRKYPYFMDYVRAELIKKYGKKKVRDGGLKVYTTLDVKKQAAAEAVLKRYVKYNLGDPDAAIASMSVKTGDVEAVASSTSYAKSKFSLATQGRRQAGSTFKTLALAEAFNQGYSSGTSYSAPGKITIAGHEFKNFAGSGGGNQDLTTATLKSTNTVFVQLANDLGSRNVFDMGVKLGATSLSEKYDTGLGIVLGGVRGISPLENTTVYATLANHGKRNFPRSILRVVFPDGSVKRPQPIKSEQTVDPGVADEVTRILAKNVQSGTAKTSGYGCPAAAKTGTSDAGKDTWLAGYSPRVATVVWVGRTKNGLIGGTSWASGVQGGTVAAPLWRAYMQATHGKFCGGFENLTAYSGVKQSTSGGIDSAEDSGTSTSSTGSGASTTGTSTNSSGGTTTSPSATTTSSTTTSSTTTSTTTTPGGGSGGVNPGRYPTDQYQPAPQAR